MDATTFLVAFTSLQILVGTMANITVIITIVVARELRKRSEDQLILNLAFADLLTVTTFLPCHALGLIQWKRVPWFSGSLMSLVFNYGGNALLALTIDRFIAIVFPLYHFKIVTKTWILVMIAMSFGAAVVVAVVNLLRLSSIVNGSSVKMFFITKDFLLLLVMTVLNVVILYYAIKQGKAILKQRWTVGAECTTYPNRILLKTSFTTFGFVSLYYITYLPLVVYLIYYLVTRPTLTAHLANLNWIHSFLFVNSTVNPFLYALRTRRFKTAFRKKIWANVRLYLTSRRVHP